MKKCSKVQELWIDTASAARSTWSNLTDEGKLICPSKYNSCCAPAEFPSMKKWYRRFYTSFFTKPKRRFSTPLSFTAPTSQQCKHSCNDQIAFTRHWQSSRARDCQFLKASGCIQITRPPTKRMSGCSSGLRGFATRATSRRLP